ncbi:MAG: hypothetical protein ACK4IA_10770 [Paracoccus hibiscisoli]|uniref:hypothetical protein n=1 Tax=Paracoccus hibiscisoli TaxID=2023261 RepID=UPI0039199C98
MSDYSYDRYNTLSSLDYWRLSDALSVIDAAILITGNDPSEKQTDYDDTGDRIGQSQRQDYDGYEAVFKALRAAIRSNRLRASIQHWVAPAAYEKTADYGYRPLNMGPSCRHTTFDFMIARHGEGNDGKTSLNFSVDDLRGTDDYFIWKEPDWAHTTVEVEHLKEWLKGRGVFPTFFFPNGVATGFRDKAHPRYSSKLAACVAAWEAVKRPVKNSSPKQTVKDWLQSNAASYGVGGESGIVSSTVAEELATIVNWATKGGATPTAANEEPEVGNESEPIDNYRQGYPSGDFMHGTAGKRRVVDDDEIPF